MSVVLAAVVIDDVVITRHMESNGPKRRIGDIRGGDKSITLLSELNGIE